MKGFGFRRGGRRGMGGRILIRPSGKVKKAKKVKQPYGDSGGNQRTFGFR